MALTVALVSPTQQVWSGEATFISARTTEGDLGVLPGHAPLFGVLVDGAVSIKGVDGSVKEFNVSGDSYLSPTTASRFLQRALTKTYRLCSVWINRTVFDFPRITSELLVAPKRV